MPDDGNPRQFNERRTMRQKGAATMSTIYEYIYQLIDAEYENVEFEELDEFDALMAEYENAAE